MIVTMIVIMIKVKMKVKIEVVKLHPSSMLWPIKSIKRRRDRPKMRVFPAGSLIVVIPGLKK